MKIEDQFRVDVPIDEAWRVLLDVERIAPCMPGAQLQEIEGDEYRGVVKVKVGPITAQYKGAAKIVEADEAARRIVLKGEGRDTRGQGNASATVTVLLAEDGGGTKVDVDTDLNVTGKVAQFGRGVMADVSAKLLAQFVASLEENVLDGDAGAAAASVEAHAVPEALGAGPAPAPAVEAGAAPAAAIEGGVRKIDSPDVEPVDLMDAAGGAVAKRLVPVLAGVGIVVVLLWLFRRRRKR
ncbi:MAG: carbon monoxide dehydrogenase [Actinobacteria bacterium]|nr:carbon monoxide dehydrogenase [Actinomycetota bacterium]